MKNVYAVQVVVKETRTYVIEAASQEEAEAEALDNAENGELGQTAYFHEGSPYVTDSQDVSEDYRDHEAGRS